MRNLIVNQTYQFSLFNLINENPQKIIAYHFDEFSKNLTVLDKEFKIFIFNYDDVFTKFKLLNTIELDAILYDRFDILEEISSSENSIKFLLYKNEEETVSIILSTGKLLKIPIDGRAEIIDLFPTEKILCVEMSSNLEFVAIATNKNLMHLLNYDFDLVNSCNLDDGDLTDASKDNENEREAAISWRGDSQFFACLYTINGGRKCLVRDTKLEIFKGPARADGKGVFSIAEEPLKNLANFVSWQPSGSLIAVFQNNSKTNNLNDFSAKPGFLFAEKNCLRHGELYLKPKDLQLENNEMNEVKILGKIMRWNMDMPLLMVYFEKVHPTKEITYHINIYHRSNYEWSLKYSKKVNKLIFTKFSDCLPLRTFYLTENGEFETIDFKFEYQTSLSNNNFSSDNGTVAVLSGDKVKLTPLRYVNMPPPMSLEEFNIKNSPPFLINFWKNYLFVLSNNTIQIIHSDNLRNFSMKKEFEKISSLNTSLIKSFTFLKANEQINKNSSNYETEGFLIMNKSIINEDKKDEILIFVIKMKINNTKAENDLDYIEFVEISQEKNFLFDKISFLFNSSNSENLFDGKFYNNKLTELQIASGLIMGKDEKKEEKKDPNSNRNQKKKEKEKVDIFTKLKNADIDNLDIGNYNPDEDELNNSFDPNADEDNLYSMLGSKGKEINSNLLDDDILGKNNKNKTNYKINFFIVNQRENKEKEISKLRLMFDKEDSKNPLISLEYENEGLFTTNYEIIKAHSAMIKTEEINFQNSTKNILEERIVYLTRNNRLYMNNNYLAADATSFEIFKNFLIFTQSSNSPYNILHILDLSNMDLALTLKQQINKNDPIYIPDFNYKHFQMRTLERTSLIVTVSKNNLIVQLSRGNLETFYPRLLVLDSIIDSVSQKKYLEAFEIVRKNKINPNFLYDIDPEGFFKNIKEFVKQINKIDYINLFINCLENSLCEEIQQIDSKINSKDDFKKLYMESKINRICDALREELFLINENDKYITSIIHSHTKKTPSEYLNALRLVQNLKKKENENKSTEDIFNLNQPKQKKYKNADQALEYLCWVVNAETLFDFSLKTYDFELVILVAKYTQKDPKEYLPYLKKLQEMDPVLMKYQINMDLKNYEDALFEISKDEKYIDTALDLIKKYELYELSFFLFKGKENILKEIFKLYGGYLHDKKKFFEAGYAFIKNDNYEKALESFKENGSILEVLKILPLIKSKDIDYSKYEEKEKLFLDMIDICSSSRKYTEVEKFYSYIETRSELQTFTLLSKISDSLIRGKRFHLALSITNDNFLLAYKNINKDEISKLKKEFIDQISLAGNLKKNEIIKNINFYKEKYARLLKVQHQKRLNPETFNLENKELEDNVSDSGSVISSSSKKSSKSKKTTSSRLTKKSQAKMSKRNVREGSPLEEDFLIMIIGELFLTDEHINEINNLVSVLHNIGKAEEAKELKDALNDHLKNVNPYTKFYNVQQQEFINCHPEIKNIFPETFNKPRDEMPINSGKNDKPKGMTVSREHEKRK